MMLKHHIKVALRNIKKQGLYSLLNIIGLSIGITLSLLVLILAKQELSYDNTFTNSELIYRYSTKGVISTNFINSATSPMPLSNLAKQHPDIQSTVRIVPGANNVVSYNNIKFNEEYFLFSDHTFFDIFDLKMIKGDASQALLRPRSVILTKSTAFKYFKTKDPIGQTIERSNINYTITGICEDMPTSTHFKFNFLASISTIDEILLKKADSTYLKSWKKDWLYLNCYTYIKVKPETNITELQKTVNVEKNKILLPHVKASLDPEIPADSVKLVFFLQPITDIHLHSHLDGELEANSNPIYIKIFIFIAIFIFLITCVNFVNLTTAKAKRRFNEIAVRQLTGASRKQLAWQFLTEAFVYSLGATFIGLVLLELLLPFFNAFFNLKLSFSVVTGWIDLFWILVLVISIGIISGAFPAFFFAGLKPRQIIKGNYNLKNNGLVFRGFLVCTQISVSVFLLVVVAGMWWQMNFIAHSNHGINTQNIMVIERGNALNYDFNAFKKHLLNTKDIQNISTCSSLPGDDYFHGTFKLKNSHNDKVVMLPINYVDQDYFTMLDLTLKTGRFPCKEEGDSLGILLNYAAISEYDIKKPLGYKMGVFGHKNYKLNVVGVAKNFHFEPYYEKIKPIALMLAGSTMNLNYILIKLSPNHSEETIHLINNQWKEYTENSPFEWEMLENRLSGLYEEDTRIAKIISVFALLALFMTILGIIALAAFIMEYKSRDIEVKKILGVSRQTIILQVFSQFSIYVITGVILALVPAHIALKSWIKSYAYYDFMQFWVYILAALVVATLAYASVFYQTYKMASKSPSDQ